MKPLLSVLLAALIVSACHPVSLVAAAPGAEASTMADGSPACVRVFGQGAYTLTENACPGMKDARFVLVDTAGSHRFASYDPAFTDWAWSEGCVSSEACNYILRVKDGRITGFTYRFMINLSEGEIEVEVDGSALRVVRKEISDQPS
jgi:hypothetical protein